MKHTGDGGSLAGEVISTVRTAQAFGAQATLARLYDKHVNGSLTVDTKGCDLARFRSCHVHVCPIFWIWTWLALVFDPFGFYHVKFIIILAFSFGTTLINSHRC